MTEEEARSLLWEHHGERKLVLLERYVERLLAAHLSQNLISKESAGQIWTRHIMDSAQLLRFAPKATRWLDIGSGAGLPGMVIAILTDQQTVLVEPRRKRVEFLTAIARELNLNNVSVRQAEIERVKDTTFEAVTARAFAPLPKIFASAQQVTDPSTIWILPKGRSAERELEDVRSTWQGVFHVEQSLTDEHARIIVGTDVRQR